MRSAVRKSSAASLPDAGASPRTSRAPRCSWRHRLLTTCTASSYPSTAAGSRADMSERKRIVCFGELLVRLSSPDGEQLLQSPSLRVHFGGAEANVAVSLARFGHTAAMASIVPPNALGAAAIGELRRHGVDTSGILTGPGRMGL